MLNEEIVDLEFDFVSQEYRLPSDAEKDLGLIPESIPGEKAIHKPLLKTYRLNYNRIPVGININVYC